MPVIVGVPQNLDREKFSKELQASLAKLNTAGDQQIKRIQLMCMPEPDQNDTNFFDESLTRAMKYAETKQSIPRALIYFLSTKAFTGNSKSIALIADTARAFPQLVIEIEDQNSGDVDRHIGFIPAPYVVVNGSSADSEPAELALVKRVRDANEAYWQGIAHARGEIKPEIVLPWVQRVIDLEAERRSV